MKKSKPKKNPVKVRSIALTDKEWAWLLKQSQARDVSVSKYLRDIVNTLMGV